MNGKTNNNDEPKLTPGVVTTSNVKANKYDDIIYDTSLEVTHDEAFQFSEEYHEGWKKIEQYWNNILALGSGAIIIGIIMLFVGTSDFAGSTSLLLASILAILGGFAIIAYALEKLRFVKTGKEYMLKANIRIRSK